MSSGIGLQRFQPVMSKLIVLCTLLFIGGIVCYFFPLFHIRPLDGDATETRVSRGVSFQLASGTPGKLEAYATGPYVQELWDGPLRAGDGSTEITRLWEAFDANAAKAKNEHGRQVGLGGAWYFYVRGQGTVETVQKNSVVVRVADSPRRAQLELGVIVDNTVREAAGVNVNDFANSQDFNAVSSELNRRVEQDVIRPNRNRLKPGVSVEFVGCARIGATPDLDPLRLIPIRLDVRSNRQGQSDTTDVSNAESSR